jgi:hypothetical protein
VEASSVAVLLVMMANSRFVHDNASRLEIGLVLKSLRADFDVCIQCQSFVELVRQMRTQNSLL